MKTKTVDLNPDQVKIQYVQTEGKFFTNSVKVELIGTNIDPALVTRIKFPALELDVEPGKEVEAKVKVTYLDLSDKDKKYASKLKNWISAK